MQTSDWIALAACIGTLLALIPMYVSVFGKGNTNQSRHNLEVEENDVPENPTPQTYEGKGIRISPFLKSLLCVSIALLVGVVQIVIFSFVASINDIPMQPEAMPMNWSIVFYALFILPGFFLALAFVLFVIALADY